jgi:glycosyltransferase involved in cell wall biosynthesis
MGEPAPKPIRVLHVVGGMNRAGTETWLMHLLRNIDREHYRMDFLVHSAQPFEYAEEIEALGSRVIPCLHPARPWRYARNLMRIFREDGPYDVVHSHVHHFTGLPLYLARRAGVPVRIAHSHSDTSRSDSGVGPARKAYLGFMKHLIRSNATAGLAASRKAAAALYGPGWESDPRWRLLYCGIDLKPFRQETDPAWVRAEIGIPSDACVIGHVGRFHEAKNHSFLVEIAFEIAKREPRMRLLLVGDGPLRSQVEQKTAQLGLTGKVIFAGVRADVPRLMLGAMDIFIMPSLYEGLPLVGIEAQAAGLPLLVSDTITDELPAMKQMVHRLSLNAPPSVWAEMALQLHSVAKDRNESLRKIGASRFSITRSISEVESCYHG